MPLGVLFVMKSLKDEQHVYIYIYRVYQLYDKSNRKRNWP